MRRILFFILSLLLIAVAIVAFFPVTTVGLYANATHTYVGLGLDTKARIVFSVIGLAAAFGAASLARLVVRS